MLANLKCSDLVLHVYKVKSTMQPNKATQKKKKKKEALLVDKAKAITH